jgi:hypothetical protein
MSVGTYSLAAISLTTALSASAQSAITGLEGMTSVSVVALFSYGSGGTTCVVVIQTSFDEGVTWLDIARFDFATTTVRKWINLSAGLAQAVATYAALGSEGVTDKLLGDRLRAVITSTGTYANTTLGVQVSVR